MQQHTMSIIIELIIIIRGMELDCSLSKKYFHYNILPVSYVMLLLLYGMRL
jgi:hypothetical protein